jgi:hypothetical protein
VLAEVINGQRLARQRVEAIGQDAQYPQSLRELHKSSRTNDTIAEGQGDER